MSPAGRRLDQAFVRELATEPHLTILCGRYEGFDERVIEGLPAEEVSIGDYVVSGGELPALVLIEAVTRLVPGVIGTEASHEQDSFSEPELLDHPHYTRPAGVPWHARARRAAPGTTRRSSVAAGDRPGQDGRNRPGRHATLRKPAEGRWYTRAPLP